MYVHINGAPHQTVQGEAVRYAQGFPSVLMSKSSWVKMEITPA